MATFKIQSSRQRLVQDFSDERSQTLINPVPRAQRRASLEERHRVNCNVVLFVVAHSDFEMKMWSRGMASRSNFSNQIAALNLISASNKDPVAMRVDRHNADVVFYYQQIAVAADLIPTISNSTAMSRVNLRTSRRSDVYSIGGGIMGQLGHGAKV